MINKLIKYFGFKNKDNAEKEETNKGFVTTFPKRIELIKNELFVDIFIHELNYGGKYQGIKTLAFLTEGLFAKGQKELLFVMLNKERIYENIPNEILVFFKLVYDFAIKERYVDIGSKSEFGENDLFGWKGILYAKPSDNMKQFFKFPTISMLLFSKEAVKAADQFGYLRILSMLGNQFRVYPHPYWSDLNRQKLPVQLMEERSFLSKIGGMNGFLYTSSATAINNEIIFSVDKKVKLGLPEEVPSDNPLLIMLSLSSAANSCLTFVFDEANNGPAAISGPGTNCSEPGGCFLLIIGKQEKYSGRIMEDGFCLMLTDTQWKVFINALYHKKKIVFQEEETMPFALIWD